MYDKKTIRKMICTLVVTFFLTVSMSQSIADIKISDKSEDLCYGFIISPITEGNYIKMDHKNCKIRHMINDFLRNELTVYWTVEGVSSNIIKIGSSSIAHNMFFDKGSFLIPFTGNLTEDNKIISIIYDYNQSSEVEIIDDFNIPIYILVEQTSVQAYPLNNVKIAQLYHGLTSGGFLFLELLSKCGFLNYNPVLDKEVCNKLKIDDYNVMFHPGRFITVKTFSHDLYSDIKYRTSNCIRSFVNNGGGYIGSCGGMIRVAAGGYFPFLYLKKWAYNPNLQSIIFLAIADLFVKEAPKLKSAVQVKIKNISSPISFGLDEILWDSYYGGPLVSKFGENVDVVGEYYNTETIFDETPVWITAKFGKGKVSAFSTHPEIAGVPFDMQNESQLNNGKTVITNSIFYLTADEKINYQTHIPNNITYLFEIWNATANLIINITHINKIFNPIRNEINESIEMIYNLYENLSEVVSIIEDIASEKGVNLSQKENKRYLGYEFIFDIKKYYCAEFIKYLNDCFTVLKRIELIHNLLKDQGNYNTELTSLQKDIESRLKEAENILIITKNMTRLYKIDLLRYQERRIRSRIYENMCYKNSNDIYEHVYSGFSQIPQIYFNSLKFLRKSWYDYESKVMQ